MVADAFPRQPVSSPTRDEQSEPGDIVRRIRAIHMKAIDLFEYDLRLQEIKRIANEDRIYQRLKDTVLQGFPDTKLHRNHDLSDY